MSYRYDPELAPLVPNLPILDLEELGAARAALDALVADIPATFDASSIDISDLVVPGFHGDPDVAVRLYRSKQTVGVVPCVLYFHGGGFITGSIRVEHDAAAALAISLGVVVVSVEYRLAPEHPFPAALHDCFAALQWLHRKSEELGVDPTRVAVYGHSAGGNLAAAVSLFNRDNGNLPICFQFLGIPELDDRLETTSMQTFVDTPMWNRPNAVLSWKHYLGEPESTSDVSPYAAPSRAEHLGNLPRAYVSTMEFDPLRDEGILYALALLDAGVSVELHSYPGTFHASAFIPSSVSQRFVDEQNAVLRRALGLTPTN